MDVVEVEEVIAEVGPVTLQRVQAICELISRQGTTQRLVFNGARIESESEVADEAAVAGDSDDAVDWAQRVLGLPPNSSNEGEEKKSAQEQVQEPLTQQSQQVQQVEPLAAAQRTLDTTDKGGVSFAAFVAAFTSAVAARIAGANDSSVIALADLARQAITLHEGQSEVDPSSSSAISLPMLLAEALAHDTKINELVLTFDCVRTLNEVDALASMLCYNRHLRMLDLSGNDLPAGAWRRLARALLVNRSLTYLDLMSTVPSADDVLELTSALCVNTSLTRLELIGCRLQAAGAEALAAMLSTNTSLTALGLSVSTDEHAAVLAVGLSRNTALTSLSLSGGLSEEDGERKSAEPAAVVSAEMVALLIATAAVPSLTSLSLSELMLRGLAGTAALARLLYGPSAAASAATAAASLGSVGSQRRLGLRSLTIDNCPLSWPAPSAAAAAVPPPSLESLTVLGDWAEEPEAALTSLLSYNAHLTELSLAGPASLLHWVIPGLTQAAAGSSALRSLRLELRSRLADCLPLAAAIAIHPSLTSVLFHLPPNSQRAPPSLLAALEKNRTLWHCPAFFSLLSSQDCLPIYSRNLVRSACLALSPAPVANADAVRSSGK